MKCVLLLTVVFAAWLGSSEATSCLDMTKCMGDLAKIAGSSEDMKENCDAMTEVVSCFREALSDCRKSGSMPEATLQDMESKMQGVQNQINEYCGNSAGALKISIVLLTFSILAFFI